MASFEIAHAEQHSQKAQQHRYAAAWAERSLTPLGGRFVGHSSKLTVLYCKSPPTGLLEAFA
jgi:hypothetical protein